MPRGAQVVAMGLLMLLARRAPAEFDLPAAIQAAAPGDTLHVPAGWYRAPLIVDRPLTLVAAGAAIIDAHGQDDVARIEAPDVILRGFTLRASGDSLDRENAGVVVNQPRATIEACIFEDVLLGVILRNADGALVRGNTIRGKPLAVGRRGDAIRLWNTNDVRIEDNVIVDCRDLVIWYSRGTRLARNEVSQSRYGMHFMYAHESVLEENSLHDNSVGVFLMYSHDIRLRHNTLAFNRGPSGYGIGLKDMDRVTIEENLVVGNRVGVFIDNSPQRIDAWNDFRRNWIAYNDIALAFLPAVQRNRLAENAFIENVEQVAILGGGTFRGNEFTVADRGNYWSDYAGFDAAGDGVGDVPYHSSSLFENLMDREPKLRLFLYGPAHQAVEFAARAFPIVRPEPKVTDDAPLMRPPPLGLASRSHGVAGRMSILGAVLLALGSLALATLRGATACAPRAALPSVRAVHQPAMPPDPILQVAGLRKRFRRLTAVDGVSFTVPAGQAVALCGENGAGKTTIIKCLLALHRSAGQILIGGIDARRHGERARQLVGYVSQELAFDSDVSALSAVAFFARIRGVPAARAGEVLAQVGLTEHMRKPVAALSGGMKQRLALAVALLGDPPLLLLDEPTSNLDAGARRAFLALLCELKRAGKTIVFSTHRPEEVAALADRIVLLERGRIVSDGPLTPPHLEPTRAAIHLRLALDGKQREEASAVLRAAGFDVRSNCETLCVRVQPGFKAEPIQILTRAGIAVSDFELEPEHHDHD